MDDSAFASFVASLWRRAGWDVDASAAGDGDALATRDAGARTLLLCARTPDAELVTASVVRDVVARRDRCGADDVALATPVGFTTDALATADAHGVDVLGPDALTRAVAAFGAGDLLA